MLSSRYYYDLSASYKFVWIRDCCYMRLSSTMQTYCCIFPYWQFFSLFIYQDDASSLRAKITVLEEELCKSRQDSSEHQNLVRKLANVLCERLLDLADSGYAITIFAYIIYSLLILIMIFAGVKRSKRSGTTREAKGGQNFLFPWPNTGY